MVSPSLAQGILDALHVQMELALQLVDPDDGTYDLRLISKLRRDVCVRVAISCLESCAQSIQVAPHTLKQHSLVLLHRGTHTRPRKQFVEARKRA